MYVLVASNSDYAQHINYCAYLSPLPVPKGYPLYVDSQEALVPMLIGVLATIISAGFVSALYIVRKSGTLRS